MTITNQVEISGKYVMNARKTRILFFIDQLSIGGTEKHLIQTLKFMDRSRFEPQVYVLHGRYDLLSDIRNLNVPVKCLDIPNIISFRAMIRLFTLTREMRRARFDIVLTYLFASNIYGIVAAKLAGIPTRISTRRELVIWKKLQHRIASRLINLITDRILTNSRAVKKTVVQLEKAKRDKIGVVYNGVDINRFDPDNCDGEFRSRLGVKDGDPLIVNVARYRPLKGQKYFVDACANVAKRFPNARFAIVGPVYDKKLISNLHAQSKKLGLEKRLLLMPNWRDTPSLYAGADIVVLSSLEEGFPNVIIEAMASGKPVVATKVGGNVEAVKNEHTGLLVPPADSEAIAKNICRLLDNKKLAKEMGRHGRERVLAKFQQQTMWHELKRQIEELSEKKIQQFNS